MGRIRMPMGIMDATIKSVRADKNVLTITADVGTAPNYAGKVEVELLPKDFGTIGTNLWAIFIWVITKVLPRLFLSARRR